MAASKAHVVDDEGLAVLPDGTVVLASSDETRPFVIDGFCRRPVVARLLPDGRPDPTFGGSNGEEPGVLDAGRRVGSRCGAEAVSVLDDGGVSFVLSGEGGSPVYPGRLAPDGSRMSGFASPSSTALTPPRGSYFVRFRLASGGMVAAGQVVGPVAVGARGSFLSSSVIIVARNANGTLRRGFGDDGIVLFPPGEQARTAADRSR